MKFNNLYKIFFRISLLSFVSFFLFFPVSSQIEMGTEKVFAITMPIARISADIGIILF